MHHKTKLKQIICIVNGLILAFGVTYQTFATCQNPTFDSPLTLTVNNPVAIAPADFNRDGKIDLAVLKDVSDPIFNGTVEMFLGNGASGFASTGIRYNAVQFDVYDLASGDFNNDGLLDLVATGGQSSNRVASILLGNGTGGFGAPNSFSIGTIPSSVAVGDFNNDGNADIIAVASSADAVSILPGQGTGNFGAVRTISVGNLPVSVAIIDINNDGKRDFFTSNDAGNTVSIKLGNGDFTFIDPSPSTISLPDAKAISVNDFNRDGKPDFAVTSVTDVVSVRLGVGNGTFTTPVGNPFATGNSPFYLTTADLNSDGLPDIATSNGGVSGSGNLSVLLNTGSGSFASTVNLDAASGSSERIYSVDINQNGVADLVVLKVYTTDRIVLLRNLCPPANKTKFDFDGDNKADVSVFRPSNTVWYVLKSSDSQVLTAQWGIASDKIVPADYNGDGKTDYAVFRDGFWYILFNGGGFEGFQWGSAGDIPFPADFDADGKADLTVFRNGTWFVRRSSGGTITQNWGSTGDIPVVADYDNDGKADFAVYRNGIWYILFSTGGNTAIQWGIASDKTVQADYNGDGKADYAVFRNGFWYILLNGGGFLGAQWGTTGDLASPADYDGDGKTDLAVFRSGVWYIQRTTAGVQVVNFGSAGDKPIPNAFVP